MEILAIIHMGTELIEGFPKGETQRLKKVVPDAILRYHQNKNPVVYLPTKESGIPHWLEPYRHQLHWIETLHHLQRPLLALLDFQSLMTRVKLTQILQEPQLKEEIHITVAGLWRYACILGIHEKFNRAPTQHEILLFQKHHPLIQPHQIQAALKLRIRASINNELCNIVPATKRTRIKT